MPSPTETLRIDLLRPSDAGEVLTVQRAAYVTEAQRYAAPHIPPLLETLEELRADLDRPDVLAVGAWSGPRLVGSVRGRLDGATIDREQLVNRGSLADPMTWDELEHKFRANVRGRIGPAAADEAIAAIASLEKQPTVTALGEALLGGR